VSTAAAAAVATTTKSATAKDCTAASFVAASTADFGKGPRLEMQISVDPNTVVVCASRQKSAMVRGTITVTSRQKQAAHPIHLTLTGTKTQHKPTQTIGVTRASTQEILRQTQTLRCMTSPISHYSVGVYTKPFVFTLDDITNLPKTLDVPQCTVEYCVQATTSGRRGILAWPFGGPVQASERLVVVDEAECGGGVEPACVVRTGVLGAYGDGDEARVPRFTVQMGCGVATAGQDVRLQLDVQVTGATASADGDRSPGNQSPSSQSSASRTGGGFVRRASMHSAGLLSLVSGMSRGSKDSGSSDDSLAGVPLVGVAAASSYVVRAKL
ncbi:hypothetical protein IW150_007240, partial [Coemansia sp. RSA 2607]